MRKMQRKKWGANVDLRLRIPSFPTTPEQEAPRCPILQVAGDWKPGHRARGGTWQRLTSSVENPVTGISKRTRILEGSEHIGHKY